MASNTPDVERQSSASSSPPSSKATSIASTMLHHDSDAEKQQHAANSPLSDSQQSDIEKPSDPADALTHTKSTTPSQKINTLTTTLSRTLSRVRTRDTLDPGPPPDGGRTAWTTAVLTHLVIFNTWGFINSFGLFQTYYVDVLKLGSQSDVAWIGGVQVCVLFNVGILSGRATDGGWFRVCFAMGSVIYLVGIFMTSLCRTYWQVFLAQGLCVGVGNGLVFVPSMAITSTYFSADGNRGKALGVVTAGSATGGLIFPAVAESLLPKVGYGWTVRVMGFVMAVSAGICMIGLRPRLPPRKSGPLYEWSAFKELPYTLFLIGAFFLFWGVYIGFYFVGSFGRNILGTSQSTSINLLLTMNGVGVLARLIPTLISDRWTGPMNLLIPSALVTGLMLYCWMAVSTVGGLWAFAVFYGVFAAGIQALFPVVLTSLTTDPKKVGVRTGMGFGIVGFAVLTGPALAGALIGKDNGRFVYTQAFAGSCMVLGGLIMVGCRTARVGWRVRAKI